MSRRRPAPPEGVQIIDLGDEDIEWDDARERQLPPGRPPIQQSWGYQPQLTAPSPLHVRPAGEVRPASVLSIARRPDSVAAQQYRLLRYKLKEGLDPRVIGVTSPRPGAGKTVVVANLGLALAEGRQIRIMLLDLNLRSPHLNDMFGVQPGEGVARQLQRKRRQPEAYWDVLELGRRLHLIAGGGPVDNPAPLLNSDALPQLVYDLAESYDYVVVDLPAALPTADVKMVQEQLDGLVLVCQAGQTTRANISNTLKQLGPERVHGLLMVDVLPRYMPA